MKRLKQIGILYIFLFLLALATCSAAMQTGGALTVEGIKAPYLKAGQGSVQLPFHVYNSTGHTMSAPAVNCTAEIYNSTGQLVVKNVATMSGQFYTTTLNGNITNNPGVYSYTLSCAGGTLAGFASDSIKVSTANTTPNDYLVLMLSILGVVAVILVVGFKMDATHAPIKLFLIWLSFGLTALVATFGQLYCLAIDAPSSIYGLMNTAMIISILLTTVMSAYFMIYFLSAMLKFMQKTAQDRKWWNKKDGEDKDR